MKVKNKLRLGFGFLFVIVLFFGLISLFYINEISNSAKVILKDNYESLNFTRDMRTILDNEDLPLRPEAAKQFNIQLVKEENNITEAGELTQVKGLRNAFNQLQNKAAAVPQLKLAERDARKYLRAIDMVNMRAIVIKNDKAHESVKNASIFLGLAGTFTFLVLFSFSINFPGIISDPLNSLLDGIREIARKNYSQRIHFDKHDEFAEVANAFNDMAARLDDWENSNLSKIMSEKLRIETIIEQMHDAIIGINETREILFINTAAKNILGLKENKPEGKSVNAIIKGNDLLKSIVEDEKTGTPFKIFADGKDSYFQLETREISIPDLSADQTAPVVKAQKSAGKVYILKNITEFKERDEAKSNFIATISHELKTPISAIKMSAKLLADNRVGNLNPEQSQLVEHISGDAERLLKITYELLDLSQVETGNIQLNFVPARPEKIIEYAVKAVKFEADQKGLIIEQNIAGNIPEINADVEKTAWVMINFLSNALRYSHSKSKIVVDVSLKGNKVEFSVKDFGKGIDAQYRERLFDRYFQVPTDGQNKSGSGLGLAISKEFITAQGGDIGVESEVGVGSRFYFQLPTLAV
ncbi:ATP-binding protein [Mucilaginibacter sp. UR6-11]|uniref:HAMP domain-containing sensor histidine kinase n=1 Tax=Mucilaginibacter sp. UR6-11 TaxID=1435644 RepID=UPI001E57C71B|nr:ATP-binding protein [Mucilaginibacter sp. UR6-11]MCC8424373.1 HAMP domain-containing protein [Mucilaginibacter sp. UR6-11]